MRNGNRAHIVGSRSADMQQAAYFYELLTQERAEVSESLDEHRMGIALYERAGDVSGLRRQRRMIRVLESEIRNIDRMLKALAVQLNSPVRTPF